MNRIPNLQAIYSCFKKTGIHLLVCDKTFYQATTASDDLGYFVYSTLLAHAFSLDPIIAATLFFYLSIGVLFSSLLYFFGMLTRTLIGFCVVLAGLLRLAMPLKELSHVYVAYAAVFFVVPFVLYMDHSKKQTNFLLFATLSGIGLAIFDMVRMYASLPIMVFLLIYFLGTKHWNRHSKYKALLLFLLGYVIPVVHFNSIVQQRNAFLIKNKVSLPDTTKHLFWHNIYMGFDFLNNNEGIIWSDSCAVQKALEDNANAHYPSAEYERTIKKKVMQLCHQKRYFVVRTLFAKLGVLLYLFFIYLGPLGVLLTWLYPKPWYIEIAFWFAFVFSGLPGLLTVPVVSYTIGFITCTIMYTIYSCLWVILQRKKDGRSL